jgi:peptidoglycan/xylan/chitin deacetylase (PgdA/CDA1 family)
LAVLCASHTFQLLGTLLLFVAWQCYFPSKYLIRLVARLPYCRGVSFEFPPSPDAPVPDSKYVALTIDDGPCPYNTQAVLDELRKQGAKATFFIIGSQVEKCDMMGVGGIGGEGHAALGQDSLRRMVTDGHELANHTW